MLESIVTYPLLSTILLIIGIVGIALEVLFLSTGLFALLGIVSFGLYFWAQYSVGFAGYQEIVLFGIGMVLLVLEIVVTSFGILGIAGGICLFSGVVMASNDPKQAVLSLGIAFILSLIILAVIVKYFKHKGMWHRFILREQLTTDKGFISSPNRQHLLGKQGVSITPLRPAGTAVIHDERIDVVTDGSFIEPDKRIEVIQIEGSRIVVRESKL